MKDQGKQANRLLDKMSFEEAKQLQIIIDELSRPEARDPKLNAIKYFLTEERSEKKTWLELGCIIFSQYYDTAFWVGSKLAEALPGEVIGVYAGAGKKRDVSGRVFFKC